MPPLSRISSIVMDKSLWKSCLSAALMLVLLAVPAQSVPRKSSSRTDASLTRYAYFLGPPARPLGSVAQVCF